MVKEWNQNRRAFPPHAEEDAFQVSRETGGSWCLLRTSLYLNSTCVESIPLYHQKKVMAMRSLLPMDSAWAIGMHHANKQVCVWRALLSAETFCKTFWLSRRLVLHGFGGSWWNLGPCCALDNMGVEMVIQGPGEPGKDVLVRDTVLSILVHLACIWL